MAGRCQGLKLFPCWFHVKGYDLLWWVEDDIWFKVEPTIDGCSEGNRSKVITEAIDFGPANFKLNAAEPFQKCQGNRATDKVSHFQSPALAAPFRHGDAVRIHWMPRIYQFHFPELQGLIYGQDMPRCGGK